MKPRIYARNYIEKEKKKFPLISNIVKITGIN